MRIYLGTCGWAFDDWKGSFYPEGTKDELAYYATHFSAVEIDSTWYRIPSRHTVESWRQRTPSGFVFCPKLPGEITHQRLLQDVAEITEEFLRVMSGLGDRLGPILVQLAPDFAADAMDRLEPFLRGLNSDFRYAVEFRHESWLQEPRAPRLLRELGIAVTMAHHPYYPRIEVATCDFTYIRLLGRRNVFPNFARRHVERSRDLAHWAYILSKLRGSVEEAYVFVNNQFEGHSPDTAQRLKEMLGDEVVPASGTAGDPNVRLF